MALIINRAIVLNAFVHMLNFYCRFGQLGHGQAALALGEPKQVMELLGDTCVQLMCGRRHTLVVVSNPCNSPPRPRLLIFGSGSEGQLGQPNLQRTFLPLNVMGVSPNLTLVAKFWVSTMPSYIFRPLALTRSLSEGQIR